ncbi:MAG: glycosyltransferase family 4 protein [Candidatus Hydrogenedentales bacterium]
MNTAHPLQSVALVGTYVPRRCGIATFTKDLRDALVNDTNLSTFVLSLDDCPEGYDYPDEVRFQIQAHQLRDYLLAADLVNINQVDVAMIQHEFGIFGGPSGKHILEFARRVRMPLITTLHTVLRDPNNEQELHMRELIELSDRMVVLSELGRTIMLERYSAPPEKVAVIPHGIPDEPFVDPAFYKDLFGLEGRTVMLTFGLLSPGKGIEVVVQAMPKILEKHPEVVYVVLGATHPHVYKREGNAYVKSLERLAARLGVGKNVRFHTRYVTLAELCRYLGAADLYVVPYSNKEQVVSGTLAYALGMGKTVISTPFYYAEEMLANDRGRLFPFGDSEKLAETVVELLGDELTRNAMRKKAYMDCRHMVWREVGRSYRRLAEEIIRERRSQPKPVSSYHREHHPYLGGVPEIDLRHLRTLTDDTGIAQHAMYCVPDRNHGYCTDDNARALITAIRYYHLTRDDSILPLVNTYLSFLHHAFSAEAKRFRNFMSYDRHWLEEVGSEDVHGRAIWALGLTVAIAPNEALRTIASRICIEALATMESTQSPRAWAFALVGIHAYLAQFGGDGLARRIRADLAERLHEKFRIHATDEWPWCEDTVTYDNGKICHALILSGQWLPNSEIAQMGLRSLEWLVRLQLDAQGIVSLIGNQGWLERSGERARFDQQPVEILALVEACAEAYRYTGEAIWRERARQFLGWFLGNNDTQSLVYDNTTGGCRDGLQPDGPNLNQGAESTLSWLLSLLTIAEIEESALASDLAKRLLLTDKT